MVKRKMMNMGMDQLSQEIFEYLERCAEEHERQRRTTSGSRSSAAASAPEEEGKNVLKAMHDFIAAYGHLRQR